MAPAKKEASAAATESVKEFVLDNSLAMAWCFEDEAPAYADEVLDSLQTNRALVPGLWPLEVANALLDGERRKRISQAEALKWTQYLAALPISVDDETNLYAWNSTASLAREQNLSAYDAAYLELAMRRGLPLATLDEKLKAAALAVGVSIWVLEGS